MQASLGVNKMVYMEFQTPDSLFQEAKNEMKFVSDVALFNEPKYQKLHEKWCAAVFGFGYQRYIKNCKLRMSSEQNNSADFYLLIDSKEYPFQITMKPTEGRKIGMEFKERESKPFLLTPYRPEEGSVKCPAWICEAVQSKVKKNYSNAKELNILVYANFEADNYDRNEIVNAVNPFKEKFVSIWVITNHALASIFTNNDLGEINDFKVIKEIWPPDFVSNNSMEG